MEERKVWLVLEEIFSEQSNQVEPSLSLFESEGLALREVQSSLGHRVRQYDSTYREKPGYEPLLWDIRGISGHKRWQAKGTDGSTYRYTIRSLQLHDAASFDALRDEREGHRLGLIGEDGGNVAHDDVDAF